MAEEKRVPVFIPEDALNEWEEAKTVTLNGEIHSIPVGQTVYVKPEIAEIINNWLDGVKKAKADYKKRMDKLNKEI